jgi:hypothetical protein
LVLYGFYTKEVGLVGFFGMIIFLSSGDMWSNRIVEAIEESYEDEENESK